MPEPRISLDRLRRFIGDADSAHAALSAASDRMRHARNDLRDAREALEAYDRSRHVRNAHARSGVDVEAGRSPLEKALAEAETAYDAASISYDRCRETWEALAPLASSAREYARSRNLLPADLKD